MAAIADTKTTVLLIINADVTNDTDDTYKYYLGLAITSFKDRYRNHISSFNNKQKIKQNCLNTFGFLIMRIKLQKLNGK